MDEMPIGPEGRHIGRHCFVSALRASEAILVFVSGASRHRL